MLCSKVSQQNAYVQFVNQSPYIVRLMWVGFQGEEVAYSELQPGNQCIQHSCATHPWIAREVSTATQLLINMQEAFCVKQAYRLIPAAAPMPAAAVVAAAAAAAAAREGAPVAAAQLRMAAEALQNAQQQLLDHVGEHQPVQQPEPRLVNVDAPHGLRLVSRSALHRAEITGLPALPWSESAHPHFPPAFKAAVRTFLLCHLQLHQAMHAEGKLQPWLPAAADSSKHAVQMQVTAVQGQPCAGRCSRSSHLGCLPNALLPHIVCLAAPYAPQHMELPLSLRPDILPTCLAEEPDAPAVNDLPNEDG